MDKDIGQPGISDEIKNLKLPVDGDKEMEWVSFSFSSIEDCLLSSLNNSFL